MCALPTPDEQLLLNDGAGAGGSDDGEQFARALLFSGARQQLVVIDTIMSFQSAATGIGQACMSLCRCGVWGLWFVQRSLITPLTPSSQRLQQRHAFPVPFPLLKGNAGHAQHPERTRGQGEGVLKF